MTRRIIDRVDSDGGHREVTIIEEAETEHGARRHDEATMGEDEVATVYATPWDVTRGWVRMLAIWIGIFLLALESGLLFRLIFELTGANPANGFVDFVYDVTRPFVEPFDGIIAEGVGNNGVFAPETVIAMLVWAVAAILLIAIIWSVAAAPATSGPRSVVSRRRHGRSVHED